RKLGFSQRRNCGTDDAISKQIHWGRGGQSRKTSGSRARIGTGGKRTRLQSVAHRSLVMESPAERQTLLPALRQMYRTRHSVLHPSRSYGAVDAVGDRTTGSISRRGSVNLPGIEDSRRAYRISLDGRDDRFGLETREYLHRHVGLSAPLLSA